MAVVPPLNFITLHYAYFIITSLVFSVIFWGASNPFLSVSYADALFMCVSAITGAGLNTVCLSFHAGDFSCSGWLSVLLMHLITLSLDGLVFIDYFPASHPFCAPDAGACHPHLDHCSICEEKGF